MHEGQSLEITKILHEWNNGDSSASERLLPFVYQELKRQARFLMAGERSGHTLQPTALVHEAFIKLTGLNEIKWNDRRHFFRFVSQIMRRILVDYARIHAADKRGNNPARFSLEDVNLPVQERAAAILHLDEALEELASVDEKQAKIIEMKFFGGMTLDEIAEVMEVNKRTISREWRQARLWLFRELNQK